MRSVSRVTRRVVAISVGAVVAPWIGCRVEAVRTASEADCARLEDLADGGATFGDLELPEHLDLPPVPDGVEHLVGTVVPQGDPPQVSADESSIGLPDADVDTVTAVGHAGGDLGDLKERITEEARAQGMSGGTGSHTGSNDDIMGFGRVFFGPDRELHVNTYRCDDTTWIVYDVPIVSPTPEAASRPLPGCDEIIASFPPGIYNQPTRAAGLPDDEVDDPERSWRRCRINDDAGSNMGTVVEIERLKPPSDPERGGWRSRLQALHNAVENHAGAACRPRSQPSPLPDGPPGVLGCTDVNSAKATASVAMVVDNDYWIAVDQTIHKGADVARTPERAMTTALTVLEVVRPT